MVCLLFDGTQTRGKPDPVLTLLLPQVVTVLLEPLRENVQCRGRMLAVSQVCCSYVERFSSHKGNGMPVAESNVAAGV